ncbi:MFS transporter [Tomitella gaofuii]|uniref:MFS transporter n=1 Tax=Tomitella gaofuii TaxID=2760083 RepID=UPI0015FD7B2D|nr:MFS transporter [Tomitella gaofuii]
MQVQTQQKPDTSKVRRAAAASFLGSMLEYYDFYIYGAAAALVFGRVFFPGSSHGALLALATFGVAYVARPVGAVVLGHFGDRIGRKKVMLFTLVLMGASTFLIGCIPSYEEIGWLAPALLVLFRLTQGFSAAGEQSGANSLTLEHAPEGRRAFFCSWTLSGTQGGFILASLVFIPVASFNEEFLATWGWRIPFWASAFVLLLAYVLRRKLEEPEIFVEGHKNDDDAARTTEATPAADKMPIVEALQNQWRDILRVILCAFIAVTGSIFSIFGLAFATSDAVGVSESTMLWVAITANAIALGIQPFMGILADKIGRKPMFIGGTLGCAVFVFVYFHAIMTGNVGLIFLTAILLTSICYSAPNAIWPSFYAEWFNTRVRYTGIAVGTQIGFALAGFAPMIAWALIGDSETNWLPVAILTAVCCVVSAGAAMTATETFKTPLARLGARDTVTA